MDVKRFGRVEIKDAAKGEVEAVFATLGVIDKDGDVTNKGAFHEGAACSISAFGHKSWEGTLPVGKGTIHEVGQEAVFKGQFFLNTTGGRDTFEVVKQLADDDGPGMEWSYGFHVEDSEHGEHDGKSVRFLKKMKVMEVSPVMEGAGVGTRVTSVKERKTFKDEISEAVDAVQKAVAGAERVVALRAEKDKGVSQLVTNSLAGLREEMGKLDAILSKAETNEEDEDDTEMTQIELALIEEELDS